jgi:hypothetical protein
VVIDLCFSFKAEILMIKAEILTMFESVCTKARTPPPYTYTSHPNNLKMSVNAEPLILVRHEQQI